MRSRASGAVRARRPAARLGVQRRPRRRPRRTAAALREQRADHARQHVAGPRRGQRRRRAGLTATRPSGSATSVSSPLSTTIAPRDVGGLARAAQALGSICARSTVEQAAELAGVRGEHGGRGPPRERLEARRRARSGRRRRARSGSSTRRASSRANAPTPSAAAEARAEHQRVRPPAALAAPARRRLGAARRPSSGSGARHHLEEAQLEHRLSEPRARTRSRSRRRRAWPPRAAMRRRARQPARAADDQHGARAELRRAAARGAGSGQHAPGRSGPRRPSAGAPAGIPIVDHARPRPRAPCPGAIHSPGLAAWKVAVAARAHRDARHLAGRGVHPAGDVGRDDRRAGRR